jgi:hypothetical protein
VVSGSSVVDWCPEANERDPRTRERRQAGCHGDGHPETGSVSDESEHDGACYEAGVSPESSTPTAGARSRGVTTSETAAIGVG